MFIYIDPGTGSMLFTVLLGLVTAALYGIKTLRVKLSFLFGGGKSKQTELQKIPFVIFSDSKRYWNVFKPICDEMEARNLMCEYWTASPDDPALSEKYRYVKPIFIGEGNKAFARLNNMNATICLSTTPDLDVVFWKRSKKTDFYIHTLHEVGGISEYRMFGIDFYDAILLSGSFQEKIVRELEEKRNLKQKDLCVVGSTIMDGMKAHIDAMNSIEKSSAAQAESSATQTELQAAGAELSETKVVSQAVQAESPTAEAELLETKVVSQVAQIKTHTQAARTKTNVGNESAGVLSSNFDNLQTNEKITVLVAPTWGASSILEKYGEKFLTALEQTDFNVIVRPHPQSKIATPELLDNLQNRFSAFEWNYDNDNLAVLSRSDIMISDFSGVIFDYAFQFDRPILYTDNQYDNGIYDSCWLDEKPWRFEAVKKLGKSFTEKDFDNLATIIPNMINDAKLSQEREKLKNEAWEFKGQAAKRTVDYLVKKYDEEELSKCSS